MVMMRASGLATAVALLAWSAAATAQDCIATVQPDVAWGARPDDSSHPHAALKIMRHAQVRRLPVLNVAGRLQGILCLNDIALRAEEAHGRHVPELSYEDAMSTFKAVCEHRSAHAAARV